MATLVFANVDDAIVEPILEPGHAEWLRTAGLRPFAALKWNDRDIPREDLAQFLANFSGDKTTVNGVEVDLSCEALCRIFRLGHGNNNAYKRPIGWISKVAPPAAKSANGYLMSSLPPDLCARIAFLKATLHLVQKAADASMSVVRQAEEPDGTWDWGPQFVEKLKAKWKLHWTTLNSGSIVTSASHIRIVLMHHRMRLEKRSTAATTAGPAGDEIPGEGASSEDADESDVGGSRINTGPGNGVPLCRKRRKLVHIGECSGGTTPALNPGPAREFEHFAATTSLLPGMRSAPEQAEKIIRQCTPAATETAPSSGLVARPEADLIRNTHRRFVQALKEEASIYRGKKMTQNGHEPVDLRVLNLEYALLKANAELKDLDEAADAADILEKMPTVVEARVQTDDLFSTDVDVGLQFGPGDREQRAADGLREMKVVEDRSLFGKQSKDGAELYVDPTARIPELEEKNAKLIQELQKFSDGLAVCGISDVNKLKDKMVQLETGISDGVHKQEKLKLEFDAKCKEVSELTTKVGHFQKSDEAKSSTIQSLEKDVEKRQETEKQLLRDLEEARAMKDNDLQKLVGQAAKETEKKHQEAMESLRNDLSMQAQRTTALSMDLHARCEEVFDLTTKVGHFEESDEAKSSRIQLLEKQLEEREQAEKQLLRDLDEARATLDNELQKRDQAAKEMEKKHQEAMESLRKDLSMQAQRMTSAYTELRARCEEVSDLTTEVGRLQNSDEAKSSRIRLVEKQLEEREQTEKQLLRDLDEARATLGNELQKRDQAAKELEKKHQEGMESLRKDLSMQAQRTTSASIDLRARCDEVSDLTTEVGRLQKSDEAKSSRIRLLEKQLEERKQKEEQFLRDLGEARAMIDRVLKFKEDAVKEMEAVRNRNRYLDLELELYYKHYDDLHSKLERAREDAASCEEVIRLQSAVIVASRREGSGCGVHGAARQEKLGNPGYGLEADIVHSV